VPNDGWRIVEFTGQYEFLSDFDGAAIECRGQIWSTSDPYLQGTCVFRLRALIGLLLSGFMALLKNRPLYWNGQSRICQRDRVAR
jgi:hypothetical protein